MKRLLQILLLSLIITSISYSQTIIYKNYTSRVKGTPTKKDNIMTMSSLSADKLDSAKVCRYAESLFHSLNLFFINDGYSSLSGSSFDNDYFYNINISHNDNNTLSIIILNVAPKGVVVTDDKAKEIIGNHKKLTEKIIKDIQTL